MASECENYLKCEVHLLGEFLPPKTTIKSDKYYKMRGFMICIIRLILVGDYTKESETGRAWRNSEVSENFDGRGHMADLTLN
jgi:hypothetical protein